MTFGVDPNSPKRHEVSDSDARATVVELRALGRAAAVDLADAIDAALDRGTAAHLEVTTWEQRELLLRALDHLRNLKRRTWEDRPTDDERARASLRADLIEVCGFPTRVYNVSSSARGADLFVSNSRDYREGDERGEP